MPPKVVIALSGGMDSATVLGRAINNNEQVAIAVGFTYGSKHNPYEVDAQRKIAWYYSVPYRLMNLTEVFRGFQSNLMSGQGKVPEGHYEAESMSLTVVPGRNMIFASILAGVAWNLGAQKIVLGVHAGDHAIYPDCRPSFIDSMRSAIVAGTDGRVTLEAPFLHLDKGKILQAGMTYRQAVPYHITRTCYKGQEVACGRCGSCQERLTAYYVNGIKDPLEYESRDLLPKTALPAGR